VRRRCQSERARQSGEPAVLPSRMIEYYLEIKLVHVAAVLASGSLFFVRGLARQLGAVWAMAAPLRYVSYAIDTVLLTAALMLSTILQQYPFVQSWLTAKVVLLVIYIVLGSVALKRGRSTTVRTACFVAAVVVFAAILAIARAHDPFGPLRSLLT
jgi:uncharacterized membrane protein SirB2